MLCCTRSAVHARPRNSPLTWHGVTLQDAHALPLPADADAFGLGVSSIYGWPTLGRPIVGLVGEAMLFSLLVLLVDAQRRGLLSGRLLAGAYCIPSLPHA